MPSDLSFAPRCPGTTEIDRSRTNAGEIRRSAVTVIKIGGSVLTGAAAYRRTAEFLAGRVTVGSQERLVAVVSAELGVTDALLKTATDIAVDPDPATLDLLWSTGELRSVALVTLALQALGVRAAAVNVHQTGLVDAGAARGAASLRPLRLLALLASHDVVVVPGFLARGAADRVVSLGRGGSDLTAVLLALGLGASTCELVKDVPGYFSADPREDRQATHLPAIDYDTAIGLAERGCALVQRQALDAARVGSITLVVRALGSAQRTVVQRSRHLEDFGPGRRCRSQTCAGSSRASCELRVELASSR